MRQFLVLVVLGVAGNGFSDEAQKSVGYLETQKPPVVLEKGTKVPMSPTTTSSVGVALKQPVVSTAVDSNCSSCGVQSNGCGVQSNGCGVQSNGCGVQSNAQSCGSFNRKNKGHKEHRMNNNCGGGRRGRCR